MIKSLDMDDADMDSSSLIPCLLCHQDLAAVPDEHEKHLKLEHKVKFKLSWIIKKTWKESVKTWEELINSYSSSNIKEETLIEDDSIEITKIEPAISEENEQDLDEKYFSAGELLAKKKDDHNLYKCSFCEKSFKTKSYVEVHEKKHSGESVKKTYQCTICTKAFNNKHYVKTHEKKEHNYKRKSLKPYPCSFCENRFKSKYYVEIHEKKHSGEPVIMHNEEQKSIEENVQNFEKIQCSFCEKSFKTKSYVEVHEKKHSGESVNLYKCSFCEKSFKTKSYIEVHEKKHTGALSEPLVHHDDKPKKIVAKDHNISYSNMCSFEGCEKECLTRDDLKSHLKTHKKQKHKCSICGKGFKTKVYVLIHEKKKHNYQCSVCEESFTSKRFIRVHEKKKHSSAKIKSWIETDGNKHMDEFEENANLVQTDKNKLTDGFEEDANMAKTEEWPSLEPKNKAPKPNTEDEDDDTDYSCKVKDCMESFWFPGQLKEHMTKIHKEKHIGEFKENTNLVETDEKKPTDKFEENANTAKTWGWPS